jgi:RNA polymerase sigma-70 factor (ECF subfamily)
MPLTAIAGPRYRERAMSANIIGAPDGDLARTIAGRAAGADAAETELYRRFAPRVRLYGLRHLRDEDAARDLMQQVLLLAIEKLREGAVRDTDMIGSFILGATRMLAIIDEQQLEGCLAGLAERERTVVLLTFYAERPSRDIAQTLGLREGNVRVIRSRAIERLRACLGVAERAS